MDLGTVHLNTSKIYSIIINLCLFIWILIPSTSSDCRLVSDGQATATVSSPADDVFSNDAADDDAPAPTLDAAQPPCSSCCCAHHPSSCIALPRRQLHLLRPMVWLLPEAEGNPGGARLGEEGLRESALRRNSSARPSAWSPGQRRSWRGTGRLGEVPCAAAFKSSRRGLGRSPASPLGDPHR